MAINNSTNGALLAIRILASSIPELRTAMIQFLDAQKDEVLTKVDRIESVGWEKYSVS